MIIWLDHATTDNNCTKEDKDLVNYGAFRCLEQERLQVEADLSALFLKRRPLQESVCEVLRYVSEFRGVINILWNTILSFTT